MACVILPSETARLVYGYLMKENLNEIALQFLESSPYLTDCCQIVKSGYQFNTKLMGKDLQDLLQEYSVIHNLVNNKVSLLNKSSLLYKRIKLRCESISEILELILFWKYKIQKFEENPNGNENFDKKLCSLVNISNGENDNDLHSNKTCSIDTRKDTSFTGGNSTINLQNSENCSQENIYAKLSTRSCTNKEEESVENTDIQLRAETNHFEGVPSKENDLEFAQLKISEIPVSNENNSCNNNINNEKTESPYLRYSSSDNMNSDNNTNTNNDNNVPIDTSSNNVINSGIPVGDIGSNNATLDIENQIKIVRIEKENTNENNTVGVYSKGVQETERNMNLDNSSVVFVGPEIENVTVNQERSQFIVIPIDYYKSQNILENAIEIDNSQKQELISEKDSNTQPKNEIVFTGVPATANYMSSIPQLYNDNINSGASVDDNIMTENDFLKNSHLMYNLEQELKGPDVPAQPETIVSTITQPLEEPKEKPIIHPQSAPLIVVSQAVLTNKQRYRTILPKKKEPVYSVVTLCPLLENNKEDGKKAIQKPQVKGNRVDTKCKKRVSQRSRTKLVKRKVPLLKSVTKDVDNSENFSMPSIKTPIADKKNSDVNGEECKVDTVQELPTEDYVREEGTDKTNEEKENFEKKENKKTETPVFVTRRNTKRLSLSTPRRRTHIRALEFETPPKTNEEKKSKTSPKAKVEQINVERKSVRNTLFKSPDPDNNFSSALSLSKKINPTSIKSQDVVEPLNELSIPIATRSPNTKLSDAWENLTGVGCVIGQNEPLKTSPVNNKMWDADLRGFIIENGQDGKPVEKKKLRKPDKNPKDNRKTSKKKVISAKKSKLASLTVSPSKMSLTAKRNTYSINGNEEGSPLRSILDDLKIVTPFKDFDTIRPAEETPLTKLLRENINSIDIDLSMINTPSFPPTPSIVITPDIEDISGMSGANYYSPSKDCTKDKVLKITDYFRVDKEKCKNKETKEMHEKVINELVCKAKEIIGIGGENQVEGGMKRPSGKILSMVKIQMLTQCDKKLCENIPINEENNFCTSFSNQTTLSEESKKSNLKVELEEKRKRALKKIKVFKENLSRTKKKCMKPNRKRKRNEDSSKSDSSKLDVSFKSEKNTSGSDDSPKKERGIFHSTPYAQKKSMEAGKTDLDKKIDSKMLDDIRQEFPPFQSNLNKYSELTEKSRKKLHYVESFLKVDEVVKFLNEFNDKSPPKFYLKPSLRRFFQVFYKWLKHPHKHEVNASSETRTILKEYLSAFCKINKGLSRRTNKCKKENNSFDVTSNSDSSHNSGSKPQLSDDDEWKKIGNEKRKDEESEDGVVSTLPLKKRKSTVQQVEIKNVTAIDREEYKSSCSENVSQAQNFLQDIDVDRFLSQIHGQENR